MIHFTESPVKRTVVPSRPRPPVLVKWHDDGKAVRFWITKNSELSVREQLARQVLLAILSEDLQSGQKLPSVRAVARRHRIHANTVSAAYHDLLEQGWLELRRGSGLYVRSLAASSESHLDRLLEGVLQAARRQNYAPEEVLERLRQMVHSVRYDKIAIAETDPAMLEILQAELGEALTVPLVAAEFPAFGRAMPDGSLLVALPTRAAKVRRQLPRGLLCVTLRLRSVRAALESQAKPPPHAVVTVVSRSAEIRWWARAMLIAVGLEPDAVVEIDASKPGWRDRLSRDALAVADVVTARDLSPNCPARIFRVIADSSLAELRALCGV